MKTFIRGVALAAGLVAASSAVLASHVASIDGSYDTLYYDTPALTFHNTSNFAFTNVSIKLTGYQGLNNGIVQSTALADIAANSDFNFIWLGATTPGNLFAYDYDDEYGQVASCPFPNPVAAICAQVGNFSVLFTAKWNGQDVYSLFSPHSNATGGFVGWEGLDPDGWSEDPTYDVHNGTLGGTLAYIDIGLPPAEIPEPGGLALAGAALAGLLAAQRRKSRR